MEDKKQNLKGQLVFFMYVTVTVYWPVLTNTDLGPFSVFNLE